jgi:NAD+ kinase
MGAEPARISEFCVRTGGEEVDRFRADGVVVSTPAGSPGYNRAANGPVVAPETGVLSVVPVAPFATDIDGWVLPIDEVTLSVERDETPVELLADGRPEQSVEARTPVRFDHVDDIETVVLPEGDRFF